MALLTKNISFCDRVCQNVISAEYKQVVLDEIEKVFGAGVVRKHHGRMDDDALERIRKIPHLACLRSNGNPYFMYMTRFNFKNVCLFVDKKVQSGYTLPRMVLAPFQLRDALFDGTLLDGEMVRDAAGSWVFLINDALGHAGKPLQSATLVERLKAVEDVLVKGFEPSGNDICAFQSKRYFKLTELDHACHQFAPSLPYTNRGLLFKPLYKKFVDTLFNFDDSLVVSVQRGKHDKGQVISKNELDRLQAREEASEAEPQKAARSGRPPSSSRPVPCSVVAPCPALSPKEARLMRIMKGTDPDSYRVLQGATEIGGLHVKNLAQSLHLRAVFLNQPINKSVDMPCVFNEKFSKWELQPAAVPA